MSNKITRESLISPDIARVAISKRTMFDFDKDGNIAEVSIKLTGIIPEGYTVDYHLDPATVIANLTQNNMTTMEQVPDDLFAKMKEIINDADNVTIAPCSVVQEKREAVENALKMEAPTQAK